MLFIMNVGQGTNRPEGWVRTNRDSVRIVYIWVRNVWVRTCRGYETTGYRYMQLSLWSNILWFKMAYKRDDRANTKQN
jgi:hypothetical protein